MSDVPVPGMTGPELVEAIGTQATLDLFLDRDPHAQPLTDEELLRLIEVERKLRLEIQAKETKRADKKAGVVEPDDAPTDT